MKLRILLCASAVIAIGSATRAQNAPVSQWVPPNPSDSSGLVRGQYSGGAFVNLNVGQYAPLQLDQSGNLKVNVVLGGGSSTVMTAPTSSAGGYKGSGNVAVSTSVVTVIPAGTYLRWSYQAQGTGYACVSWVPQNATSGGQTNPGLSISVSSSGAVTCGGWGAFLISPTSGAVNSSDVATENTPLLAVAAPPPNGTLALNIAWDAQ